MSLTTSFVAIFFFFPRLKVAHSEGAKWGRVQGLGLGGNEPSLRNWRENCFFSPGAVEDEAIFARSPKMTNCRAINRSFRNYFASLVFGIYGEKRLLSDQGLVENVCGESGSLLSRTNASSMAGMFHIHEAVKVHLTGKAIKVDCKRCRMVSSDLQMRFLAPSLDQLYVSI